MAVSGQLNDAEDVPPCPLWMTNKNEVPELIARLDGR
jgi:hypothetical protein